MLQANAPVIPGIRAGLSERLHADVSIDLKSRRVWCRGRPVVLTPKAFALLHYLVDRQGDIVSKDELLRTVWAGVKVGPQQVKQFVAEVRKQLQSDETEPALIETVRGFGYRFIGIADFRPQALIAAMGSGTTLRLPPAFKSDKPFVGRYAELAQMCALWQQVCNGDVRACWITGDAGMGKTAIIDQFLCQHMNAPVWLLNAKCLRQCQAGEPLLPVLTALAELCEREEGNHVLSLIKLYAPGWLVQLPQYHATAQAEVSYEPMHAGSHTRLLRDFLTLVATLAESRPVVVRIEDAQWADAITVNLLDLLTQQLNRRKVLILGSTRPLGSIAGNSPFAQFLLRQCMHGAANMLSLGPLRKDDIESYLLALGRPTHLLEAIHDKTQGYTLVTVKLVEHMCEAAAPDSAMSQPRSAELRAAAIRTPRALSELIEAEFHQLNANEQKLLEAASICGPRSSAASIAAALSLTIDVVEYTCERLARQHCFLRRVGTSHWPDGTVAAVYAFLHPLYHEVIANQITPYRHKNMQAALTLRLQEAYHDRSIEASAELATHLIEGGDDDPALPFLQASPSSAQRPPAFQLPPGCCKKPEGV